MPLQITKTSQTEWKPLVEEGVKTKGIYVKILRFDEAAKRPPTFLLKFDAGASYPNHNHPGGEEVFVLEGEVRFGPNQCRRLFIYSTRTKTFCFFKDRLCNVICRS